jgi:ribosomal protein L34E
LLKGGRLVLHLLKKHPNGKGLQGIKIARPHDFKRLSACNRTVARPYGGVFNATEVKEKIMRAFLIEEFKTFKNMKTTGDKKDKKKKKGSKKEAKETKK